MGDMILNCSSCGFVGEESLFTLWNRTGDNIGRCKQCKAILDKSYRVKKDVMPGNFDLKPDILKRENVRIGVLRLQKIADRRISKKSNRFELNFGIKAVLSDLKEPYEVCQPDTINQYDFVLISLTSVMDIENLIYTFEKYCPIDIKATVIVGGFGVINIKLIVNYIDVAVFGRAEGQITEVLNGFNFDNVWRKKDDPMVLRHYKIRQPQYLVKGENSVGCRNRCAYCQYTHTRHSLGGPVKYNAGQGMSTHETDWNGLIVDKPGKYITAWDGWSEATRRRVNKPVTDKNIVSKLIEIGNNPDIAGTVSLKTYQIVGYPWETEQSVMDDIAMVGAMLKDIDSAISNKITIAFYVTPFGPEPYTPMKNEPANIYINWRDLLAGVKVYYGVNIKAFIITAISGPFTLLKRVFINRAEVGDIDEFKALVFDSRLKRMPERYKVGWLIDNGKIDEKKFDRQGGGGSNPFFP
jgi:hypothetical protein